MMCAREKTARQNPQIVLNCRSKPRAAGLFPLKEGDRVTVMEVIALLMLIIAVINLVLKTTKKK
jgi:hypothetical protein